MTKEVKKDTKETKEVEPKSPSNIYEALFQVQSEVMKVKMESTNPHFKSRYADLESVMETIRSHLLEAGILLIQKPSLQGNMAGCITELYHVASSSNISNELVLPVGGKGDSHAIGSCITYARRYSLMSMLGLVPSEGDDDGNAGSGKPMTKATEAPKSYPLKTPTAVKEVKKFNVTSLADDEIPNYAVEGMKQELGAVEIKINHRYDISQIDSDKLDSVINYVESMNRQFYCAVDMDYSRVDSEKELLKLKKYEIQK